jgi:hypothetical protein
MTKPDEPIRPMTLGNMRLNGVRPLVLQRVKNGELADELFAAEIEVKARNLRRAKAFKWVYNRKAVTW